MKQANIFSGTVVLAIGLYFAWGGSKLPFGTGGSPEAGFVPFWEGVILGIAGLALAVGGIRQTAAETVKWPRGNSLRMIVHLSLALLGYIVLVEFVGYVTSTFLFMMAAGSAWRRYSWRVLGASAAAFSLLLFVLFDLVLKISLPHNPFGLP